MKAGGVRRAKTSERVTICLSREEVDAISRVAFHNEREIKQQIVFWIRRELARLGLVRRKCAMCAVYPGTIEISKDDCLYACQACYNSDKEMGYGNEQK